MLSRLVIRLIGRLVMYVRCWLSRLVVSSRIVFINVLDSNGILVEWVRCWVSCGLVRVMKVMGLVVVVVMVVMLMVIMIICKCMCFIVMLSWVVLVLFSFSIFR